MTETSDPTVSTIFEVEGVRTEDEVLKALQALFDVFADEGLGQATFEVKAGETTHLVVKHKQSVTPDRAVIAEVLASAGDFRLVD